MYCVAPDTPFQVIVGVVVEIVVPGALPLPGVLMTGGECGLPVLVLTTKYRVLELALSHGLFFAVMFQRYWPLLTRVPEGIPKDVEPPGTDRFW